MRGVSVDIEAYERLQVAILRGDTVKNFAYVVERLTLLRRQILPIGQQVMWDGQVVTIVHAEEDGPLDSIPIKLPNGQTISCFIWELSPIT
jgi:hypothetical protein